MLLTLEEAFKQKLRDIYITVEGVVSEILPDDIIGVPHQRFLIITKSNMSILVVHNIEAHPRIELFVGAPIQVSGTYVWNRYGGIIHETHDQLNKNQPEGTIKIIKKS